MAALGPGDTVSKYVIRERLGRGGMGTVFLAWDPILDREVALKVINAERASDPTFHARFLREAEIAMSLEHENVIPIYDRGQDDGHPFLVMRVVDGHDLGREIDGAGRLDGARVCRIVDAVASALDAAHARGLVHRDVKPGNVMLARPSQPSEHVYLTDFGLVHRSSGSSLTRAGEFLGTEAYAPPEQLFGEDVDHRADVFALACVASEALTGARGRSKLRSLPPPVQEVVAKGTAAQASDRYDSAGQFADALRSASARPPAAEPRGATTQLTPLDRSPTAATEPPTRYIPRRRTRRSRGAALAAVAAVGAVGAGVLILSGRDDDEPGDKPSSTATASAATARPGGEERYRSFSPDSGYFVADVPAGTAWSDPREAKAKTELWETTVRGRGLDQVVIDITPGEIPTTLVKPISKPTIKNGIRRIDFRGGAPAFPFCGRCVVFQRVKGDGGAAILGGPTRRARAAAEHAATSLRLTFDQP